MFSRAQRLSMLDGFLSYNQVNIDPTDRENTTFTTPWGTFMYARMPFGLSNVGETFQRAMDVSFMGQVNKFVLIYLDDTTVFYESDHKHLKPSIKDFDRCRKFGISLNPKNYLFSIKEGKLLGHIISKEGVVIDPKRFSAIERLTFL